MAIEDAHACSDFARDLLASYAKVSDTDPPGEVARDWLVKQDYISRVDSTVIDKKALQSSQDNVCEDVFESEVEDDLAQESLDTRTEENGCEESGNRVVIC